MAAGVPSQRGQRSGRRSGAEIGCGSVGTPAAVNTRRSPSLFLRPSSRTGERASDDRLHSPMFWPFIYLRTGGSGWFD